MSPLHFSTDEIEVSRVKSAGPSPVVRRPRPKGPKPSAQSPPAYIHYKSSASANPGPPPRAKRPPPSKPVPPPPSRGASSPRSKTFRPRPGKAKPKEGERIGTPRTPNTSMQRPVPPPPGMLRWRSAGPRREWLRAADPNTDRTLTPPPPPRRSLGVKQDSKGELLAQSMKCMVSRDMSTPHDSMTTSSASDFAGHAPGTPPPLPRRSYRSEQDLDRNRSKPKIPQRRSVRNFRINTANHSDSRPFVKEEEFFVDGVGRLSLNSPSSKLISFMLITTRDGVMGRTSTNRVFFCDHTKTARLMQCRFKQALMFESQGETLFDVQNVDKGIPTKIYSLLGVKNGSERLDLECSGDLRDVLEEWQFLDWDGNKRLAVFNGKEFTTRLFGETKSTRVEELEFLDHNQEKCKLRPMKQNRHLMSIKVGTQVSPVNFNTTGAAGRHSSSRQLPTYTFKETALQIEKDRAIFAKMGVDSSQLALDGLLKAEFGHRPAAGPCLTVRDVTNSVQKLIVSGTLALKQGQDLEGLLGIDENAEWRETKEPEFLFLQYRVAGEPKETQVERVLQADKKVFVGLKKLVPVVKLTCADLVDRLIEVPSSLFTENFFLTLPYHSPPHYVLRLLLNRTYPNVDRRWRPRIFAVLKKWAMTYPEDFESIDLLHDLLDEALSITSLTEQEQKFHARESERLLRALNASLESMVLRAEREIPFTLWPSFLGAQAQEHDSYIRDFFHRADPKSVAEEFTLLAQKRLQSLSGRDFIKKGYDSTRRNQMKISDFLARWIGTTVLVHDTRKACVKTVNQWLVVAKACREMRNFNSLFEIMVGLQQTPVARICKGQDGVDEKSLKSLKSLVAMDGNYKEYRAMIKRQKGRACVPYFGVLLRDMLCYEEAKPKVQSKTQDGTVWVNIKKCERMGQLVSDALLFKGNRYTHTSKPHVLSLIENAMRATRDENALYDLSYRLKPRGT